MTQQQLAETVGTDRGTINGYCTGRLDLGMANAKRIARILDVTVLELGGPAEEGDAEGMLILDRLRELEAALNALGPQLREEIGALGRRVLALERRRPPKTLPIETDG
jgi:transcriptional regulator with XRE-family HTH domain